MTTVMIRGGVSDEEHLPAVLILPSSQIAFSDVVSTVHLKLELYSKIQSEKDENTSTVNNNVDEGSRSSRS